MEASLTSSLRDSPEKFLRIAGKIQSRREKSSLKTLIWTTPSSSFPPSLPSSLSDVISRCVKEFKKSLGSGNFRHQSQNSGHHNEDSDPQSQNLDHEIENSGHKKENSCHEKENSGDVETPPPPPTKKLRRSTRNPKPNPNPDTSIRREQALLHELHIYTCIAHLCTFHPNGAFPPSVLLPAVQALHDSLSIYEPDPNLQLSIASLCEEWWKKNLPDKETLISQSVPYLLSRSLSQGKKSDLRRVYALKETLTFFDFMDTSIEDLKLLLVRCVITPLYLKTEEGRKFIAFLFGLNIQLLKEILAMIRSQIPFGRKSMLEGYGEIVFRAWKVAESLTREEIDNGFLQSLIEGAIHAGSRVLASSARRVLGAFVNQRTIVGVEGVLFRLTEPVLFRSLQVANSNVRQNALLLLIDLFPLEDPSATKEVQDTLLDKQFFLLEKLLNDDCPGVRVVAVEGTCRILCLFWEVIPSSTTSKLLSRIVESMSCDTCSEVRLSVLNGLIYLLNNPQTHEVLKVLLPRVGRMFQDPVLSIRLAVADLLLALKDVLSFQYTKVVGIDTLVSSLAEGHPLVSKRVTRLLIPSYFPSNLPVKEACSRCITLIKRSPQAGARFCEYSLSEGSSPESLLELVKVFVSLVLSANDMNPINRDGIFMALGKLCCSLSSDASCKEVLQKLFSGKILRRLLTSGTRVCAQASILEIASTFSTTDVSKLLEICVDLVTECGNLCEDTERQAAVRFAHTLLLSFDLFDELLETLTNLLQRLSSGIPINCGHQKLKKKSKKKSRLSSSIKNLIKQKYTKGNRLHNSGQSNVGDDLLVAGAAWQVNDMLTAVNTRRALLDSPILGSVLSALKSVCQTIIEQCLDSKCLNTSPVRAYIALSMHMALHSINLSDTNVPGEVENSVLHSSSSLPTQSGIDYQLDYILACTEKLFDSSQNQDVKCSPFKNKKGQARCRRSKRREPLVDVLQESELDVTPTASDSMGRPNLLKMVTTILKSILDAAALRLISHSQKRCLLFASAYIKYVNSILRTPNQHHSNSRMKLGDSKLTSLYLKSSFSYVAKLLNWFLTDPHLSHLLVAASYLASDLLDLFSFLEPSLGSRHTSWFAPTAKPWLPDLILALGSRWIKDEEPDKLVHEEADKGRECPMWIQTLASLELAEIDLLNDQEVKEESESSSFSSGGHSLFKKLVGMVVELLRKGDPKIRWAIGAFFMSWLECGLARKDCGLVLGLVRFVYVKVMGCGDGCCVEDHGMMVGCMKEILSIIDEALQDSGVGQEGKKKLQTANGMLESVCMLHA
ncbi:hypothetical protein AMTRI_Chr12g237970 [Amborella trichopoda]